MGVRTDNDECHQIACNYVQVAVFPERLDKWDVSLALRDIESEEGVPWLEPF